MNNKYRYDLGIIGGMGSEATVEVYKRIIENTFHTCDQDHMKICILNNSIIPDRTDYIVNNGENPLPYLNESIKDLENINAKYFIIPCNTAHYFESKLEINKIKFISMVKETLQYVHNNYKEQNICILSTTGTIKTKVYHNHDLSKNLSFVYLNEEEQSTIMSIINDTKKGINKDILKLKLLHIVKSVSDRYKNIIFVLACTELSLYQEEVKKEAIVIDAMDCLVKSTIIKCGYKLNIK